jgi:PmbA protein
MTDALAVAEAALGEAVGAGVEVIVQSEHSGLARFAGSEVHQPTLIADESVTIRVVRDGSVGTSFTNRTDADGLRAAAQRASEAADSAPADPGFPGLARPAPVPEVAGYDADTAAITPEDQAHAAWAAIGAAPEFGLFGYFTSGTTEAAVASTTGIAVSKTVTDASVLAIAADNARSGYAEAASWRAADLDPAVVAREAAGKATRTAGAVEIEPGTKRAVLEPYAFSELLWYFGFSSLNALAFLDGRSYLSDRLGEQLFHPSFTVLDDALDPRGFPKSFDFEGVPKERVLLIDGGVARNVVWDRRTAHRAADGRRSTGHALPSPSQGWGPIPFSLSVAGGDATLDELVASVGDGIYVTRLHYLGVVDPREGIITGMTRDGTFLIEGGKVTRPVVNLRFTTSFPELVKTLLGLTSEITLVNRSDFYDDRYPFGTLTPAVATGAFTIVGTGSGPGL